MSDIVADLRFPLKPFRASATLAISGATVHGAVFCITVAYWESGCRSLPTEDAGLQALARTYGAQWMRVRDDVKRALTEIVPALAIAHAKAVHARQGRIAAARQGGLGKARKLREEASMPGPGPTHSQAPLTISRVQPVRASPYAGNGRTDMQTRQASVGRERSAVMREGLLSESPRRPR